MVRDWLPDAEAELKFHAVPEDEDNIMQLIENHEVGGGGKEGLWVDFGVYYGWFVEYDGVNVWLGGGGEGWG